MIAIAGNAQANPAISGRPVPALAAFDDAMGDYMDANGIEAGVLGVMRNGVVIYLRGFGSLNPDTDTNMPENAIVRLASCTKPITAAAVRCRIGDGAFTLGQAAFLRNGNNGVLNVTPFPGWGDNRYGSITVQNLLQHAAGWDRNTDPLGDLMAEERRASRDMDLPGAPGRTNLLRWITGKSLWFSPGTDARYSNEGYFALSLMVAGNFTAHMTYLHERVFTPNLWVPASEVIQARTARSLRDAREPWYRSTNTALSASDPSDDAPMLDDAYGGQRTMEVRIGNGGIAASAAAMLALGNTYHINVGNISGAGQLIGLPIDAGNPLTTSESHNGGLPGTNTILWHRTDGIVGFAFFNKDLAGSNNYASQFRGVLDPIINGIAGNAWPTASCDGFWVRVNSAVADGPGGYHATWNGFGNAITKAQANSRLRLKAGDSNWTGTINKRLRLDAPLGQVRIGFSS